MIVTVKDISAVTNAALYLLLMQGIAHIAASRCI